MRLVTYTLVDNSADPVTGAALTPQQRFERVVDQARWAETLGLDAYGVGERHAQRFISSSPPVLLSYIAAHTKRIRLLTTVTVLSLLDPVRVAEDYATLDQLGGGRLEIIIGKGNDPDQNALFGYDLDGQWDRNREKYELLRRLLREERVTWSGACRPDLTEVTTQPRPLQRPSIPVWHGSASSTESTELAAQFGEPLFSANGFHPMEKYAALIRHYRERLAAYGHDPEQAVVGAGFIALLVAPHSQDARRAYEPAFRAFLESPGAQHNRLPFTTLEEFIEQGSALIGSPEEVLDKIGRYHDAFGHELTGVPLELAGVPDTVSRPGVELFMQEVAPRLRRDYPSRVWQPATAA